MEGKGDLILTGQLGDVMQESARAAISYARSRAAELGIEPGFFDKRNDPHPRPGRRDPEGRPLGRDHDGDRADLGPDRPPGPQGRGDDRRDHAARQGAADRRPAREDAGRAPRRHQDLRPAEAATPRTCPSCRTSSANEHGADPGRHPGPGSWTPPSSPPPPTPTRRPPAAACRWRDPDDASKRARERRSWPM